MNQTESASNALLCTLCLAQSWDVPGESVSCPNKRLRVTRRPLPALLLPHGNCSCCHQHLLGLDLLIVGVAATEMACARTTEVIFVCPCDHVCEGSLWCSPSVLGSRSCSCPKDFFIPPGCWGNLKRIKTSVFVASCRAGGLCTAAGC